MSPSHGILNCARSTELWSQVMGESVPSASVASSPEPIANSGSYGEAPSPDVLGSADDHRELAARLLTRLVANFNGIISLRLWTGSSFRVGSGAADAPEPRYTLVLRGPDTVAALVLGRDPLRFADLYFRGELDIEGDFFDALELRRHLSSMRLPLGERIRCALAG